MEWQARLATVAGPADCLALYGSYDHASGVAGETLQRGVFGAMEMILVVRRMAGSAAIAAMLSACGTNPPKREPETTPRYTYQQARQIVDQSLRAVADSLQPSVILENVGAGEGLHPPCAGPNDDRDTGLVMYELRYRLSGLQQGQQASIYQQVKDYWAKNSNKLVLDEPFRAPPTGWELIAAQPDIDFAMRLQQAIGPDGILSLSAQSPCVEDGWTTQSASPN